MKCVPLTFPFRVWDLGWTGKLLHRCPLFFIQELHSFDPWVLAIDDPIKAHRTEGPATRPDWLWKDLWHIGRIEVELVVNG